MRRCTDGSTPCGKWSAQDGMRTTTRSRKATAEATRMACVHRAPPPQRSVATKSKGRRHGIGEPGITSSAGDVTAAAGREARPGDATGFT